MRPGRVAVCARLAGTSVATLQTGRNSSQHRDVHLFSLQFARARSLLHRPLFALTMGCGASSPQPVDHLAPPVKTPPPPPVVVVASQQTQPKAAQVGGVSLADCAGYTPGVVSATT